MRWILQNNLFGEKEYDIAIETLDRMGLVHSTHKVRPFISELDPEPAIVAGESVIVMGSTSLTRIARERGWTPGSFWNDNFDFEVQRKHWGSRMLNADAIVCTFDDVLKHWNGTPSEMFLRPVHDTKSFTGEVMSWERFKEWHQRLVDATKEDTLITSCTLQLTTPVVMSTAKALAWEYRLWVVDGKVVASSAYRNNGRLWITPVIADGVVEFAEETVAMWSPDRAFVFDVAETEEGFKILEVNNLNSAGFYACNIGKLIEALENSNDN